MEPCRPALVGLAVVLAGIPATVAVPTPAPAEPAIHSSRQVDRLPCSDLLFLDARGSGDRGPEGQVLPAFREAVVAGLPGRVTSAWLDYPAVSTHVISQADLEDVLLDDRPLDSRYFSSVEAGVTELTRVLGQVRRRCPREKVVLVGFSQGAEVVSAALSRGAGKGTVAATLLIGNPSHYPGQHVRERDGQVSTRAFGMQSLLDYLRHRQDLTGAGTRPERLTLLFRDVFALYEGRVDNASIAAAMVGTTSAIPAADYPTTFSLCAHGDVVCDFAPAMSRLLTSSSTVQAEVDQARPVHGGYTPATAHRTIDELLRTVDPKRPAAAAPAPVLPVRATPSPSPSPRLEVAGIEEATPVAAGRQGGWPAAVAAALLVGLGVGWWMGRRR